MTMTLDLRRTVSRFGKPITRRRYTNGTAVKGRVGVPTYVDTAVNGYVAPVDGKVQLSLPEALREHVGLVMYTNDDVRTVEQAAGELPDAVIYGGETYQCREVRGHSDQGLFRVIALQLVQPGSD